MLFEFPGEALGRHLKFFVLRPFDIDDRPTRGANDTHAPRSKRDAVRSEVETRWSEVGEEEVLETRAGLHEVEEVAEGLRLAEMELGFVRPDVIVDLERDEQIEHDRFTAPVERRARIAGRVLDEWEGIGCVGALDEGGI